MHLDPAGRPGGFHWGDVATLNSFEPHPAPQGPGTPTLHNPWGLRIGSTVADGEALATGVSRDHPGARFVTAAPIVDPSVATSFGSRTLTIALHARPGGGYAVERTWMFDPRVTLPLNGCWVRSGTGAAPGHDVPKQHHRHLGPVRPSARRPAVRYRRDADGGAPGRPDATGAAWKERPGDRERVEPTTTGDRAPPVSRREATLQTRRRLLDAALAILDEEGERGLTTTAVTRRAGLAQSGFYAHFADMGTLVRELVADQWAERRAASREARRTAGTAADATAADVVRASFRSTVTRAAAHPALLRLVLRSRLDPTSPLGEVTRAKDARTRTRIAARLTADAPAATTETAETAGQRRRALMVADVLMAATETLVLGHLDDRYRDVEEIIDVLVAFATAPGLIDPATGPAAGPPATANGPPTPAGPSASS